jgi:hypothetical protein
MDDNEDLYLDLDSKTFQSGWNTKRNIVQSRKKGWIKRLKKDINNGKVDAVSSAHEVAMEQKHEKDKKFCLPPIHVNLKKPPKPLVEQVSSLSVDVDHLSQSVLCMVCFNYVSIGNERVVCQHCPVVIHCSCIKNAMDYVDDHAKQQFTDHGATPTSYDITWTCAFCIHDIKKKNHDAMNRYQTDMVNHIFKSSIVKMQAFFRMYPKKMEFKKKVASAKILQRLHRNRHFRVAVMNERLVERRAVRIRIHEVIAYLEDPEVMMRDVHNSKYQLDLDTRYFVKVDTNMYNTTNMEYVPLPIAPDAINFRTLEAIEAKERSTKIRRSLLTDMMIANNGGCDPSSTLRDVDKGPFPPKTFFLTITVSKSDDLKQLYRLDIPLKEAHHIIDNEETASRLEVVDRVSTMLEGNPSLYEHVTRIKLYPPQPYILFPACPGGVMVTMTLSRVTEWPRAYYICDHSYVADHPMIWRQVSCLSHGMIPHDFPSVPAAMRRLQMYIKKGPNDSVVNKARQKHKQAKCLNNVIRQMNLVTRMSTVGADMTEYDSDNESIESTSSVQSAVSLASITSVSSVASTSILPNINDKTNKPHHYVRPKIVTAARVLWTIMPTPNAGVVVGYMNFHTSVQPTSSFIKYWCVVVDKCLMIYKNRGDTKPPRENINLTKCHFTMCENDIMRIYRPSDKQVWYCKGTVSNKRHDWVAWIQTACLDTP